MGCNTSVSSNRGQVPTSRREFLVGTLGMLVPPPESFARVVKELSDPETGPPADNLISNEDSFPRVATELARCDLAPADFTVIRPSLEDAVVSLLNGGSR